MFFCSLYTTLNLRPGSQNGRGHHTPSSRHLDNPLHNTDYLTPQFSCVVPQTGILHNASDGRNVFITRCFTLLYFRKIKILILNLRFNKFEVSLVQLIETEVQTFIFKIGGLLNSFLLLIFMKCMLFQMLMKKKQRCNVPVYHIKFKKYIRKVSFRLFCFG